jgi:hypothetical protein
MFGDVIALLNVAVGVPFVNHSVSNIVALALTFGERFPSGDCITR